MNWVLLTQRHSSVLESYIMILSSSKGLKKEVGFGYTQIIVNYLGKNFVPVEEKGEIYSLAIKKSPLSYIDKLYLNFKKMKSLLERRPKTDYLKFIDLWIKDNSYFYIAKVSSDKCYQSKKIANKEKLKIERWRNDNDLYSLQFIFLRRLSKQFKIPIRLIDYCTIDELIKIIKDQEIDLKKIRERFGKPWSIRQGGDKITLFLEDLDPIEQKIIKTKIIKGKIAFGSKTKIRGVVGRDIIVAIMTTPSMVAQMRAAKAVITDEGGVLCHAAITAREFKIPTIIGTKIGTQVLKDGDMVEIDAEKGVVKIV